MKININFKENQIENKYFNIFYIYEIKKKKSYKFKSK